MQDMLHESLHAYVDQNIEAISEVAREDDEVDALYRQRPRRSDRAHTGETGDSSLRAVELILVARYLERIADHITNVGERIAYMETGEIKELH